MLQPLFNIDQNKNYTGTNKAKKKRIKMKKEQTSKPFSCNILKIYTRQFVEFRN